MPRRSKVSVYEQIRKARERERVSIRELSRRSRVHRRDVRAALESAVPPVRERSPKRAGSGFTAAIVDRVTFNAHIIETGTESFGLRTTRAARSRRKAA